MNNPRPTNTLLLVKAPIRLAARMMMVTGLGENESAAGTFHCFPFNRTTELSLSPALMQMNISNPFWALHSIFLVYKEVLRRLDWDSLKANVYRLS